RELVDRLRAIAAEAPDAASAVERMLEESGLVASFVAEGGDEASARAENLKELVGAAQEYDLSRAQAPTVPTESLAADLPPLQGFLERISLVSDADQDVGEGRVALMTLHAAKGLEFDAVFIAGMEEGVFPHQRSLKPDASPEEMEEERRLCYVGFTRARKRLFAAFAQARSLFGELKFNPPSRFLSEVPRELFDFADEDALAAKPVYAPVPPRRRAYEDDDGPRLDRSYSQVPDFVSSADQMIGLRVRHSQFGDGEIVSYDGQGPTAKVTVRFPKVGLKRVVARFLSPL
ncbi:MAG TPA: 3'-5' exonuclease, partial [Myxococcaceae bacterium]|nr:3'-5' exonuclease [Myxococcaceae bacterium]